jgi:hypothetical protein
MDERGRLHRALGDSLSEHQTMVMLEIRKYVRQKPVYTQRSRKSANHLNCYYKRQNEGKILRTSIQTRTAMVIYSRPGKNDIRDYSTQRHLIFDLRKTLIRPKKICFCFGVLVVNGSRCYMECKLL